MSIGTTFCICIGNTFFKQMWIFVQASICQALQALFVVCVVQLRFVVCSYVYVMYQISPNVDKRVNIHTLINHYKSLRVQTLFLN